MKVAGRFTSKDTTPPCRGYISQTWLSHFSPKGEALLEVGRSHARYILNGFESLASEFGIMFYPTYSIAFIFCRNNEHGKVLPMAEFFGFDLRGKDWPGNPGIYSWVFKNGVYQPAERNICCGDALRILTKEEETRLGTSSLEDYLNLRPFLGDLQPMREMDEIDL